MESTIYIFIVVYLLRDITSIYLPKIKKIAFFCSQPSKSDKFDHSSSLNVSLTFSLPWTI